MDALIPFTTSGSLVDLVDKKVLVILRDGRKLLGVFRSYDQYDALFARPRPPTATFILPLSPHFPLRVDVTVLVRTINTANFLLESTVERLHHKLDYADRDIGVLLIRGENVVVLGEIDLIAEDMVPLRQVSIEEIEPRIREESQRKERENVARERVLGSLGFVTEGQEGDAY